MEIGLLFRDLVERRLEELGENAFSIEKKAGLPQDAIRNVLRSDRRNASPRIDNARQIAEALGLEFYVGPPRDLAPAMPIQPSWRFSDSETLPHVGFAKCGLDGWTNDAHAATPLPAPEGLDDADAFFVTAKGQSMLPEGIRDGSICLVSPATSYQEGDRVWLKDRQGKQAIKRLVRRTDTSLVLRGWQPIFGRNQDSFDDERMLIGLEAVHPVVAVFRQVDGRFDLIPDPVRTPNVGAADPGALRAIRLHDVQASAGSGREARDGVILSEIGFPVDWLARHGISPARASLIHVDGDSMSPTIESGAMALVDHNRTTLRKRRVYAFREGDALYVKRLERIGDQVLVESDNPDYDTRLVSGADLEGFEVIGEVVWTGREWG